MTRKSKTVKRGRKKKTPIEVSTSELTTEMEQKALHEDFLDKVCAPAALERVEVKKKTKQNEVLKEVVETLAKMIISFSKVTDVIKTSSTFPSMAQCVGEGIMFKILQQINLKEGFPQSYKDKYQALISGVEAGVLKYKSLPDRVKLKDVDLEWVLNFEKLNIHV
jgi:negative regulator of genetic competence, sporulation and motility